MSKFYCRANTIGNLQNGGLIADDDKYIYIYLNNGLYKIDKQSSERKLLYKGELKYLNIKDDFIYFVSNRELYKIFRDEVNEEAFKCLEDVEEIFIVADWIYCSDSWAENIVRYNINNFKLDNSFKVDTVHLSMAIDNNNIYFSDEQRGMLETFSLLTPVNGQEGTAIDYCNENGVFFINIEDEWIYYLERNHLTDEYDSEYYYVGKPTYNLYRVKRDGSNRMKLINDYVNYINVEDGWIYFSNISDGGNLYKMRVDGKNKIKLCDCQCENIHIVYDWIYYYIKDNDIYRLFQQKLRYFQSLGLSFEEVNKRMNEYDNGILIQPNPRKLFRIKKDGTSNEEVKINL